MPAPLSDVETRYYRACTTDSDCVYVTNGCCDCSNGGEDLAINKAQTGRFLALFAETCSKVHCNEMGSIPACGSGHVSCIQGLCEYRTENH